jgi:hypothetical protein
MYVRCGLTCCTLWVCRFGICEHTSTRLRLNEATCLAGLVSVKLAAVRIDRSPMQLESGGRRRRRAEQRQLPTLSFKDRQRTLHQPESSSAHRSGHHAGEEFWLTSAEVFSSSRQRLAVLCRVSSQRGNQTTRQAFRSRNNSELARPSRVGGQRLSTCDNLDPTLTAETPPSAESYSTSEEWRSPLAMAIGRPGGGKPNLLAITCTHPKQKNIHEPQERSPVLNQRQVAKAVVDQLMKRFHSPMSSGWHSLHTCSFRQ